MALDSVYPEALANTTNLPDVVQFVDTYDADHMNMVRAFIRDITQTIGINPQGSMATLKDRLAVSLADDGKLKHPGQYIIVAQSHGDFQSIQAAIDSITDATVDKIYTVFIMPGVYAENIVCKPYVHLMGLNKHSCIIKTTDSGQLVTPDNNIHIQNLTLEKAGNRGAMAMMIFNKTNVFLTDVRFLATDPEALPIFMNGGDLYLNRCWFQADEMMCVKANDDDAMTYHIRIENSYLVAQNRHVIEIASGESSANKVELYNSTLIAGSSKTLSWLTVGSGAIAFKSAHCRLNKAFDVNSVDLISTPYNVIDPDLT